MSMEEYGIDPYTGEIVKPVPRAPVVRPTIHYADLPEDPQEDEPARNWNFYRREVGRLLSEGNEGKWVLIKNAELIGLFDTYEEARRLGLDRFLMEPILIHQVLTREPLIRGPSFMWRQCRA